MQQHHSRKPLSRSRTVETTIRAHSARLHQRTQKKRATARHQNQQLYRIEAINKQTIPHLQSSRQNTSNSPSQTNRQSIGLDQKSNFKQELQGISDTLNRIQIPVHPFTQHNLGLKFSSTEHIQSDHINGVILKQPQQFTLLELIQQFTLFYNSHPALMRDIKD